MPERERRRIRVGLGSAIVIGTAVAGAQFWSQRDPITTRDFGTSNGVQWSAADDGSTVTPVVSGAGHRISPPELYDFETKTRIGPSIAIDMPGDASLVIVACVDGKWQRSPQAAYVFRNTKTMANEFIPRETDFVVGDVGLGTTDCSIA
jgi:hypothetical protein